jgi:preprotein translocase subunit SecB
MSDINDNSSSHRHIVINMQYVKDLSLENPFAPASLLKREQPKIDLSVDISVNNVQENAYEVAITITSSATSEETKLFMVELTYAGVFTLINIPEEEKEQALLVHCPSIIFPFARRVIADVTRDAGYMPLMIDPIDFQALYIRKMEETNSAQIN